MTTLGDLTTLIKSAYPKWGDVGAAFEEVESLIDALEAKEILIHSNSGASVINTNSTSASAMTGSAITIACPSAGTILYLCSMNVSQSDVVQGTRIEIFLNGTIASASRAFDTVGYLASTGGSVVPVTPAMAVAVSAGSNTVDTRWYSGNASYTHYSKVRYAFGIFIPS